MVIVNYSVASQLLRDRWDFANRTSIDDGAPPRLELFKRIAEEISPGHFEWHDWTNRQIEAHCNAQWLGITGAAGSAKTYNAVGFACIWWLCDPEHSSVILCSTTISSFRRRGWAEVGKFYSQMEDKYGNFLNSRMMWRSAKDDDKHAIFGIAVEEGSLIKVADNIKGIHTKRQLVIIDEFTSIPPAIVDACINLSTYPDEFLMVGIGNARSHLDQHGRWCEPVQGWSSIGLNSEEWESVPKINGKNGLVIRFDAERSPNIVEGRVVSTHLPTKAKVEARRKHLGGENNPSYWSNDRGFWPPEGLLKTIFSESALAKHDGYGKHIFTGRRFQIIGAFDPAYGGGDRPTLRFAKLGEILGGKMGIELMPPIILEINAADTNPTHYQLTEQTRRECEHIMVNGVVYSCPPENLGVDDTGPGGVSDIMQRTWNAHVIRIEFGGKASEEPVSPEDLRPANLVYQNKITEMSHRARLALDHDQLKGIDKETAIELCNREYDDSAILSGRSNARIKMMPKRDYKAMFGKSCDLFDTAVMILEVAYKKGFRIMATGETVNRQDEFEKGVELTQAVYEDMNQPEEIEDEPEYYAATDS